MPQSEIDISSCDLCPRVCGADRSAGARGVCGADGRLRIARAALHFWEEPPISGTHGSGTVFFSWCPLRCVYCQNAVIADGEAGAEISIERLAQTIAFSTGDRKEGTAAFLEKRPAQFKGC